MSADDPRFAALAGAAGRWAMQLDAVDVQWTARARETWDGAAVGGQWSLAFIDRDGRRETLSTDPSGERWTSGAAYQYRPAAAFDFDGDGAPELALGRSDDTCADASTELCPRVAIYTARGGVRRYPPSLGFHVDALVDVDHDGRPDLVLQPRFRARDRCGRTYVGPHGVARSRPDGTFADDPVVALQASCPPVSDPLIAMLERSPPPPPPSPAPPPGPGSDMDFGGSDPEPDRFLPSATALRIVCARLRGVSPDVVAARLEREYLADPWNDSWSCLGLADLQDIARRDPRGAAPGEREP